MSLDLTILFPSLGFRAIGESEAFCYERLRFDGDYSIFGQLVDMSDHYRRTEQDNDIPEKPTIKTIPIPPQLWVETYGDEGIERTREDRYGTELTFVYAQQLKKLSVRDDASTKNKAIKAFINALPDDMPVILYWH